jgi:hypothetical protein
VQVAEHLDADGLVQAADADRFAASSLPMVPVPMMATVLSAMVTLLLLP